MSSAVWRRALAALCVLWAVSQEAASAEPVLSPALSPADLQALAAAIDVTDLQVEKAMWIRCAATVHPGGQMRDVGCFGAEQTPPELLNRVIRAARRTTITPARANGRPVRVAVPFSIIAWPGSPLTLRVVPNHGFDVDLFGVLHFGPQRLDRVRWSYDGIGGAIPAGPQPGVDRTQPFALIEVEVDETGQAGGPAIRKLQDVDLSQLEERLRNVRFIPGRAEDGSPVPMRYVEMFWARID